MKERNLLNELQNIESLKVKAGTIPKQLIDEWYGYGPTDRFKKQELLDDIKSGFIFYAFRVDIIGCTIGAVRTGYTFKPIILIWEHKELSVNVEKAVDKFMLLYNRSK